MCKTAGVQAAVDCPRVQAGGAGSKKQRWCNCTCTDIDVQSSSNGDGTKLSSSGLFLPVYAHRSLLDPGSNSPEGQDGYLLC